MIRRFCFRRLRYNCGMSRLRCSLMNVLLTVSCFCSYATSCRFCSLMSYLRLMTLQCFRFGMKLYLKACWWQTTVL